MTIFCILDNSIIKFLNLLEKHNIKKAYINPTPNEPVLIVVKIKPIINPINPKKKAQTKPIPAFEPLELECFLVVLLFFSYS